MGTIQGRKPGSRRAFMSLTGGHVAKTGEGNTNDLFTRSNRDQVHQGSDSQTIPSKVGTNGVAGIELIRQRPEAKGEFVQLLNRSLTDLLLGVDTLGALGSNAKLTSKVLDSSRRAEKTTGLAGGHESRQGRNAKTNVSASSILELANNPSGECLQWLNSRSIRDWAGLDRLSILVHGWSGESLGWARGEENVRQAESSTLLGVWVALASLVQDAEESLPLVNENTILSNVKDSTDSNTRDTSAQGGNDFVKLSESIVSHNSKWILIESLHSKIIRHSLGNLGNFSCCGASTSCFGKQLQQDTSIHASITRISKSVFDWVCFRHTEKSSLLSCQSEGTKRVPLNVWKRMSHRGWGKSGCSL
mmetsp:Transcript_8562/g.14225  ORF Transcript_8562/g.14225 Transcript_8562/m.14225 type:complete len:361 (-) Transcript_8562:27-1109(-)